MFREMVRKHLALSEDDCLEVLKKEKRGVLSMIGDNGYPYGLTMDFWYCEEDGHLYFHCGKRGHKIDSLKKCDKVCFTVHDDGYLVEGDWAYRVKSVVIFGRIRFIEDEERIIPLVRAIGEKYTDDNEYIETTIKKALPAVMCLELVPEHMSGKLVTES